MTALRTTSKQLGALALAGMLAACGSNGTTSGTAAGSGGEASAAAAASGIAPGTAEDLAKNVGDRVYFSFDKAVLSSDAQATLNHQATWLAQYPNVHVQIAGNCDERGTEEYNIALGQRRASTARDYLAAKGVPTNRISTISFGKERPQPDAVCNDESCWAKNRNAITSVE